MMPFRIGADASCTDGACGQVSRIIVDPVAREVTHLVVDPKHRNGPGRLVPADLVDATTGQIRLHCSLAIFGRELVDVCVKFHAAPGGAPGWRNH